MTYPTSLPIAASQAQVAFETDRDIERASNGDARGRVFYTAEKRSFQFSHPGLSSADLATFNAFYVANLAAVFNFYWPADGVTYSCLFAREPSYRFLGGGLAEVSVELAEV